MRVVLLTALFSRSAASGATSARLSSGDDRGTLQSVGCLWSDIGCLSFRRRPRHSSVVGCLWSDIGCLSSGDPEQTCTTVEKVEDRPHSGASKASNDESFPNVPHVFTVPLCLERRMANVCLACMC